MTARCVAIALCAPLLAGCPSFLSTSSARTLDQGKYQLYWVPKLTYASTVGPAGTGHRVFPGTELGARYGLTDRLELGGRSWAGGFGFDSKLGLVKSPAGEGGLDLSVGAKLGYVFGGEYAREDWLDIHSPHSLLVTVPLLASVTSESGHFIVLGPRVVDRFYFGGGLEAPRNALYAGTSAGFGIKITVANRPVWLMPEAVVLSPIGRLPELEAIGGRGVIVQGAIGFFGGN